MTRRTGIAPLALALLGAVSATVPGTSHANAFVGDLVYCDLDANGIYDGADYPLDGVAVQVTCTSDGQVCLDTVAHTGELHPSIDVAKFNSLCSPFSTWDPTVDLAGRYLVEMLGVVTGEGCLTSSPPWLCTMTVDESTLPAGCNGLVTPMEEGFPFDGNLDGDHCDLEDGPFVEGQYLGDNGTFELCEAYQAPAPTHGSHMAVLSAKPSACSLFADFGYSPEDGGGAPTRTPGFWKNHPKAVGELLPVEFCGETVTDVCRAVELLSLRGGDLGKFTRHAVAALLNCAAFGCSDEILGTVQSGSDACAANASYPFEAAGDILDSFNNSGEDVEDDLDAGPADPMFCE